MASFAAKIGWKRHRKRENKNYRSIRSCPTRENILKKNSKKIQKIKIYHYAFISSENRL